MNYLIDQGKIAIRIRKHLREFVAAKDKRNDYINELVQKDYEKSKEGR